jgi:hypothetical protein
MEGIRKEDEVGGEWDGKAVPFAAQKKLCQYLSVSMRRLRSSSVG